MVGHRHIPYLPFHKEIIREICRPQKDDLLIMAKGLGMRRVICALLKTYDRKEDLVLVVNATSQDEAGIGDELGIMGVRDPGFRIMTYEMSVQQREEMYRHGGLFSVTSKILINDFLKGNVPVKLITGLVVLHAEKVHHGSQEEFAVRLYRRENQSGFCKAFSDEPETFAHGLSPLKDMLVNLNMNNVMVWPRYNEAVKASLTTRKAEVAELYQPMTEAMRQCQDAVTGCMEAMLVELKRDHSLNLDLEDLNVRNAQFKSFDTIVRMRLKPVWNKVGTKTRIHVASLTELRNLQTWLLEYDSATFASYVNTLQRQHFHAQKTAVGPGKHVHDWFNARAATNLVEASQARVSRRKVVMDNEAEDPDDPDSGWHSTAREERDAAQADARQFADDEDAMRDLGGGIGDEDMSLGSSGANGHAPQTARELREEEEDDDVMEAIATQSTAMLNSEMQVEAGGDSDDELLVVADEADGSGDVNGLDRREEQESVPIARPPPVFRAFNYDQDEVLRRSVAKRLKKGHEPVLEELPKWSLLAKVLKEIEDTMERIKTSHAGQPGTNTTLIMCTSDRTVLQLRQYLTTMQKTDPPFNGEAGRRMMNTLFLSNWQHERIGSEFLSDQERGAMVKDRHAADQARTKRDELHDKRMEGVRSTPAPPTYKRRRTRGGHLQSLAARMPKEMELEHKEAMMAAQSAFTGGLSEAEQTAWAVGDSDSAYASTPAAAGSSNDHASVLDENGSRNLVESSPSPPDAAAATTSTTASASTSAAPPTAHVPAPQDAFETILAQNGVLDDSEIDLPGGVSDAQRRAAWLEERGLAAEDWADSYGLLEPEETVIIRAYGGEDDDILLNELRPRFVVLYEPNLAFIRRLEVYKNCSPGLALRVYQMMYANSFEEDRFLSTMQREDEAFKKLIDDRSSMVIPIYNNNPRAPMRDNVSRAKTTYSSRNAGGGEQAEEPKIIVDIREMGALLPSLIDAAGIKVIPATLTVGDYILNPRMCVERKSLDDLVQSLANGRLHTQCESMTAHYEVCILLIEFEEESFGFRPKDVSNRGKDGAPYKQGDSWSDFYIQSKLVLLALHFPKLRIIWSSSPHETVKILGDLKLNHDEPDEMTAVLKGSSGAPDEGRPTIENANAVEMLRAIPGVQGFKLKRVMEKVEGLQEFVQLEVKELHDVLGQESGNKAYGFMHRDIRGGGY